MKQFVYGPAASSKSYLNMKAILEAACLTGADSIHPGFGFLSENASFAKICNDMGIKFIGPSGELINLLGNKSKAKRNNEKSWSTSGTRVRRINKK